MSIQIDEQKCTGCGLCTTVCLRQCLCVEAGHVAVREELCFSCGHCVAVCPAGAVAIPEYRMDLVEELNGMEMDPDQLQLFMSGRRSIRQYRKQRVEQEKLEKIIETGRMSPTGSNLQNVRFVVVQDQLSDIRKQAVDVLARNADDIVRETGLSVYGERFLQMQKDLAAGVDSLFYDAPALVIVLERGRSVVNGALAASRMELMAAALGLGACYNGFFVFAAERDPDLREKLGYTQKECIATTFTVGYPAIAYQRTAPRKAAQVKWM